VFGAFAGFEEVEGNLKIHPELRGSFQAAGKQDGSLRRHITPSIDESVHALYRHTHPAGQFDLADLHGEEKLVEKDFSGMRGLAMFRNHGDRLQ
jgi:hypothetical protein